METELQLLDAIRKGDRGATRRLYERYSGHAMAIGLRYVPERDAVRDVMQDSFAFVRRYDYGVIDTGDYYLNNP